MKLNQVITNPTNPRTLKNDKFEKLLNSIIEFPQMMLQRPIVIDEGFIALGGNMRDKAVLEMTAQIAHQIYLQWLSNHN